MKNIIDRFKAVHSDTYDYSQVEFINSKTKIKIICRKHGLFLQNIHKHISGRGCPFCKSDNMLLTTQEFINKSKRIHENTFDYTQVDYKGYNNYVTIICKIHGEFQQKPSQNLRGHGCSKCARVKNGQNRRMSQSDFIEKSRVIHNNRYEYTITDFTLSRNKVSIMCKIHGVFSQNANSHMLGAGCPICKSSKGEFLIMSILDEFKIRYIREYKFEDCILKNRLSFDFYLPEYKVCIEYDGIQHYKSIDFFGGETSFIYLKKLDNIKNEYCLYNNILLYRFNYKQNKEEIKSKLTSLLGV